MAGMRRAIWNRGESLEEALLKAKDISKSGVKSSGLVEI